MVWATTRKGTAGGGARGDQCARLAQDKSLKQADARGRTDESYAELRQAIADDGLRALIGLERHLRLGVIEVSRGRDSLVQWERRLTDGHGSIEVLFGTKGGKERTTHLPNPAQALVTVREAISVLDTQGHPAQGKTLKQAEAGYRNAMHRLGVQGHSLRYAFARERLEVYLTAGIPMAEALARPSMDLGHGDGRGRWRKAQGPPVAGLVVHHCLRIGSS